MAEYERFGEAARGALDIAAEGRASIAWRHDGTTETAWVLFVSTNYFSMVTAPTLAGQLRVQHARRARRQPRTADAARRHRRLRDRGVIVAIACIGPALRASRLDPLVALRTD